MGILCSLLKRLGLVRAKTTHRYAVDEALHPVLVSLANQQQSSPDDMVSDLLSEALSRRQMDGDLWQRWEALTPRQKQVTALICLGYTNRQIAAKLGISMATVHTHSGNIQSVFLVNSKSDLRYLMSSWDFSDWDRL